MNGTATVVGTLFESTRSLMQIIAFATNPFASVASLDTRNEDNLSGGMLTR